MDSTQIHHFIKDKFLLNISINTIHHLLNREPRLRSCKAIPMDKALIEVPAEAIYGHIQIMFQYLSGIPAHSVWNMDEMGHQTFVDAIEKVCFAPSDFTKS